MTGIATMSLCPTRLSFQFVVLQRFDYQLIKTLAENEFMINSLFGTTNEKGYAKPKGRQQHKKQKSSPLQDIALVVDAMMGDTIQIKLDFSSQITLN